MRTCSWTLQTATTRCFPTARSRSTRPWRRTRETTCARATTRWATPSVRSST
ncbi:hypothetical protein DPMN_193885 [Dreissena polymorpha]|uniref:Uncharacterized protein n=1 Tax=Dreissena polymorpha TaxID=45954 RepID=A0A9D3Y504_DREPO|nr:hypothetical protein DPMN_193885 [Dreissena polymorpha]